MEPEKSEDKLIIMKNHLLNFHSKVRSNELNFKFV